MQPLWSQVEIIIQPKLLSIIEILQGRSSGLKPPLFSRPRWITKEEMKFKLIISTAILISILGCKKDQGPRALVALKTEKVYKTHEGDSLQEVFSLSPGDQCAVGREAYEKMYGYYEVVCPGKGYGWVVMTSGDEYKIVDKASAKQPVK